MHGLIFNSATDITFDRTIGAHRVATHMRTLGWDIEIIDFANFFSFENLCLFLKSKVKKDTKFIGFSSQFGGWYESYNHLIKKIKLEYPDIITIVGGHLSQIINCKADYFISGYGENAVIALLEHYFGNTTHKIIFDKDWLNYNGRKVIRHISYPSAPMKSLLIKYEDRDFIQPDEWLSLEFSRGCIFECKFCTFPILGVKSDYSRDADDMEYQLKDTYDRFGITNYYVADETFNDSTAKLRKFSPIFDRLGFNPLIGGFIRTELLVADSRKEDIDHLLKMNFRMHLYGIETLNPETAKIIGKSVNTDKLLSKLLDIQKIFKSSGPFRGEMSLIVGLPKDTRETILRGYEWLKQNWNDQAVVYWPLSLHLDPMVQRPNLLAVEKEKYGYEIIPKTQRKDFVNFSDYSEIWKNENFTCNEAFYFAKDLNNQLANDGFKKGFQELSKCVRHFNNLELGLQASKHQHVPNDKFIRNLTLYKEKKLSV